MNNSWFYAIRNGFQYAASAINSINSSASFLYEPCLEFRAEFVREYVSSQNMGRIDFYIGNRLIHSAENINFPINQCKPFFEYVDRQVEE